MLPTALRLAPYALRADALHLLARHTDRLPKHCTIDFERAANAVTAAAHRDVFAPASLLSGNPARRPVIAAARAHNGAWLRTLSAAVARTMTV